MDFTSDIRNFLASHPYSPSTKQTYSDIIPRVFGEYSDDLAMLSPADLLEVIESKNWGNARQCLALAATQKYLRWKYGERHPALSAKIKRIKGKQLRSLDSETALTLLASFDTYQPSGARNLALASLALDTGLRASELCRLELKNINFKKLTLQVLVKGQKWSSAVFSETTAAHIQRWLNYRKVVKGQDWLFTAVRTGEKLSPRGLNSIVRTWGENLDIKLSPHDLRRSFATLATEAGAPERVLMEGGRWENSAMIIKYTQNLRLESMRKYLPTLKLGK